MADLVAKKKKINGWSNPTPQREHYYMMAWLGSRQRVV